MAQLDLKKTTIRFVDGRRAALTTTNSGGVNGQVTLTDVSTHRGTKGPITITLINPGADGSLSIAVTGLDIVVTLAYATGAITTTAAQLRTAINADPSAAALVLATLPGTGATLVQAQAETPLANGPRTLQLKILEGTISYTEKVNRKYVKDRGMLSTVQNMDEEPVDVKFDLIWEFVTASTGGNPTPIDVMKHKGEAAVWTSSDVDACAPFAVDIEIVYDPDCAGVENEYITIRDFRYENIDFNLKEGSFSASGKSNAVEAFVERIA